MSPRLFMAILSSCVEEGVLAAVVLLALPMVDIILPTGVLVGLMVLLAVNNTLFFWIGSRALKRPYVLGLPEMAGVKGKTVGTLSPKGMVIIRGELWQAKSTGGEIAPQQRVVVVGQDGLSLLVRPHEEENRNA